MEKDRILYLVNKRIAGDASATEMQELQDLLQKHIGTPYTHKVFMQLYNIESLITASERVSLQKLREQQPALKACERKPISARQVSRNYLSPHFFIRNNLFRIYCALTVRQLARFLC